MVMEALALLKFWKTTTAKVVGTSVSIDGDTFSETVTLAEDPVAVETAEGSEYDYDDDDEESFFELELPVAGDRNENLARDGNADGFSSANRVAPSPISSNVDECSTIRARIEVDSKPSSKPQSPISILRSAVAPPKLRVFMFGKLVRKSSAAAGDEDAISSASKEPFEQEQQYRNQNQRNSKKHSSMNFRIEDASSVLKFSRSNRTRLLSSPSIQRRSSTSSCSSCSSDESSASFLDDDGSSKRFSKELIQKYLNLIRPLYVKVSKRTSDKDKFTVAALIQSPPPTTNAYGAEKQSSRFKVSSKSLKKSRSASAAVREASTPPRRSDDSLVQQNDAIEGAILHCKRSLNASRDRSLLSRCTSDNSYEKSNSDV